MSDCKYYPPGTRKGRKSAYLRGYIDGKEHEVSTDARNKREAKTHWQQFCAAVIAERSADADEPDDVRTFGMALLHYQATGKRSMEQIGFIERFLSDLEHRPIGDIRPGEIRALVKKRYPCAENSTRNRQGITPIQAVINCAAEDEWCRHIRIKKFPETKRAKRRPQKGVEGRLLAATSDYQHLYLTVIFRHGFRVTETLGITWEDGIDLERELFVLYVGKARTEKVIPMHPKVMDLLKSLPQEDRTGKLFHWANRSCVDSWLTKLTEELGVKFTSHMARHEWASASNEHGFTEADMVRAGSWTDVRSLKDYTDVNLDHARKVILRDRSETKEKEKNTGQNAGQR